MANGFRWMRNGSWLAAIVDWFTTYMCDRSAANYKSASTEIIALPLITAGPVRMADNFDAAVEITLGSEGGYVNDPNDPGGETNFGISKRAYPDIDIKALTLEDAKAIYRRDYWLKANCHFMPWPINALVFDTAVNHGISVAVKILQKAMGIKEDGIPGPQTLNEVSHRDTTELASWYLTYRTLVYMQLSTWDKFGRGWLRRLFTTALRV